MLKNKILAALLLLCFVPCSSATGGDRFTYFDRAAKSLERRGDADGAAIMREFGKGDPCVPRILSQSATSSHPDLAGRYSTLQKDLKRLIIGHGYAAENAWRIYRAEAALDLVSYELEQQKDANTHDVTTYLSDAQWMLGGMTRGAPTIASGIPEPEPEPEPDTVAEIAVTVPVRRPEPSPTPRVSLTLSSPRVVSGRGAWLRWNARDANEVALDGERVDSVGIRLVHPTENHRYQIVARGADSKVASAVTELTVVPASSQPSPPAAPPSDQHPDVLAVSIPPRTPAPPQHSESFVLIPPKTTASMPDRFTIPSTAQPPDSASIRTIETLVDALRSLPRSRVRIEGHTDGHGSAASNLKRSRQRAAAMRNFIVHKYGIAARRFDIVGRGESSPITPDQYPDGRDNPEGHRQNQRLEFFLIQ